MISKLILLISFFFLALSPKISQQGQYPRKTDFFELDIIGNLYFVEGGEVQKYSADGRLQQTYRELMYGDITTIDVRDAMNVLVFFRDFNKVVMLDNQLSIKNSPIDLSSLGYSEASHVCMSHNNGFWIYDPVEQELLRFNQLLENTDRSGSLRSIIGYDLNPVQIKERDNHLIIRDQGYGVFVFDKFGAYLRRLPFTDMEDLFIRSGSWQMLRKDTNYQYNHITHEIDTIALPLSDIKEFRLTDEAYYILQNSGRFSKVLLED